MNRRTHYPALKHGAYSAVAVLPGESKADFDKLHRQLIDEYAPNGVHEEHIISNMAQLIWRLQNFETLCLAKAARDRCQAILVQNMPITDVYARAKERAQDQAQNELGDAYELTEVGEAATFDGVMKELEIREHLEAAIARCLKQFLMVRGVKSIRAAPPSPSPKRITGPSEAA